MYSLELIRTYGHLLHVVLTTWVTFHPGLETSRHASEIADAIAFEVLLSDGGVDADGRIANANDESSDRLAAVMAEWAAEESWLNPRAVGDGGSAFGVWQIHGAEGWGSLLTQARGWLARLEGASSVCPEHPLAVLSSGSCFRAHRLVARRLAIVKKALDSVREHAGP